ncbi:regulator of chromosome condensation 1/beta-lactamase-inhibitor protein II [Scheffersomyces coipomensis]|uniref:regulator of chromosome condensation 1/beta-lactamase-inhibitor protein II n=1 Tax=Scheffersomyces coipomensis TaxID=1788519 RepID=UPI00315CE6C9
MVSILDLGDDILTDGIAPFLSYQDIFNFSITCQDIYNLYFESPYSSIIYKILYGKIFSNNDNENHHIKLLQDFNWERYFKLRIRHDQKVYTWGSNDGGRLGYLLKSIPQDHQSIPPGNFHFLRAFGVHTPTNVVNFNDRIIIDIIANGFCFIVLTNNGQLYHTGSSISAFGASTPGPHDGYDFYEPPSTMYITRDQNDLGPRRTLLTHLPNGTNRYDRDIDPETEVDVPQGRRRLPSRSLRLPPEQLPPIEGIDDIRPEVKESEFITKLHLPPLKESKYKRKIISINCGRRQILALDNQNNLYTWDTGTKTNTGIRLKFPGLDITEDKHIIEKIFAGWNISGCYIATIGLIIWYSRVPFTKRQFEQEDFTSNANYFIVPNSKHNIVDFALGEDVVLVIKKSDPKKLYSVKFNAQEMSNNAHQNVPNYIPSEESLDGFNQWLKQYNYDNGIQSTFSKLNCCFRNFVVFTNYDSILLGNKDDEDSKVKIIDELQHQNIKSIEIGDFHYLALTTDGNILSWGNESKNCGSLGLGSKEILLEQRPETNNEIIDHARDGFTAPKPLLVKNPPFPGKWVSIAASGWHSGGIYVPIEDLNT